MKISTVVVHNFRTLIDVSINFQNYSVIVGKNNAGKSNVIDAIRAFYEKDGFKYKWKDDFPHVGSNGDDSWIEITYLGAARQ